MGRRIPVNLTPQQAELIFLLIAVAVIAVLVGLLLESVVGRSLAIVLRATGHKPPRKSFYRMRLDQLDEELGEGDHRTPS